MIFFYVKHIQSFANVFPEYKECLRLRIVRGRISPKTSLFLCAISSVNPLTYIIAMIFYKYRNNALVITYIYKDENRQLINRVHVDSVLYIVNKHIVYSE